MQATTSTTFADWYRQAHPGLVEAVLRAVRQPALAADALDEAFARAFAGWDRVQAMRSPAGWVYRVAVNEARRQLRRAQREGGLDGLSLGWPPAGPAPAPGGEAWLLVAELPVRQRAAVVLRHVAGLTEAEIGAALGVTRSTVSSSLASAYRNLAAKLAEDEPRSPAAVTEPAALALAVARRCLSEGCDVEWLDGGTVFAAYSDAVQDAVKVRPGDLVAVDPAGPTVVWRWWSGTVESVSADGPSAVVSRNVTQAGPSDPRRASVDVELPTDLLGGVEVGETVWFGSEDGRKVVVAVAGPEAASRLAPRLPELFR